LLSYFSRYRYVQPHHWKALAGTFWMIWLNKGLSWKLTNIRTTLCWFHNPKQVYNSPKRGFVLTFSELETGRTLQNAGSLGDLTETIRNQGRWGIKPRHSNIFHRDVWNNTALPLLSCAWCSRLQQHAQKPLSYHKQATCRAGPFVSATCRSHNSNRPSAVHHGTKPCPYLFYRPYIGVPMAKSYTFANLCGWHPRLSTNNLFDKQPRAPKSFHRYTPPQPSPNPPSAYTARREAKKSTKNFATLRSQKLI